MKGRVTPVSGISRMTPPMIRIACSPIVAVSPPARSFEKPSLALAAITKPRWISTRKPSRMPDPADVAELGGDGGEHEVGRQRRDHGRAVAAHQEGAPEPGAEHPALGQRVERLDELEALALGVVEGAQPVLDPALDARHDGVDRRRARPGTAPSPKTV